MNRFPPLLAAVVWLLPFVARANDPGGGSPTGGADVTLSTTSSTVTLSNGIITAVIQKASGKVSSYLLNGTQMVDTANPIYYSMDGGASYEQPSNTVYSVTNSSTSSIDVSFKQTWSSTGGYKHAFDIDLHFVLRRGDTGLYAYAVLDHPASYPATAVGEWRIVWKLPRTSTTFQFERNYVDALRNWQMPSYYDYQNASPTGIAEIVKLNTGVMAGKYDGKYTYSARYYDIGTWGQASNIYKKGVWFVLGGHDYFNDGPTKQDLTSSESYILMHFGRNHYGGSGTTVAAGEAWRKLFGPFLLYCNQTTAATDAGDVLWADAKAQVEAEKSAWPYAWLNTSDHPAAAARGTVTGRLVITDPLKPAITGANAMVGLAAPEEVSGNWQFQSKGYQYWSRADANGNFTLPAVRPGNYTLYAFSDGVVGEFSKTGITVTAGTTLAQGTVPWTVSHPGTSIAWEIGTPNRTAAEFKHGNDYFTPYLWDVYPNELPNPLVYTVGTSNPATDWNYVHSNYRGSTPGTTTAWNWDVNFNLPTVPRSGNAVLTVAFASSNYARLFLFLNGEATSFARISPPADGGNALLRQGIHAKYSSVDITIPVSRLRQGSNTFRFNFSGDSGFSSHVMYDYLRLELPDFPPPPPDSGRSIVWAGGSTTAANTWDSSLTPSFFSGGSAVAFGPGDSVSFTDSGSNSPSLTLTGILQPNQVQFNSTKSYTLTGTGELSGPMSLTKSGSSTLSISQANTYSGSTSVNGGVLALTNDTANSSGLGTSDVTLRDATLRMFSNISTSNTSFWNIDVPGGGSGTLEADARCDLKGKLTGSGTFRYRLPSGAVRASILGDWSAFSGTVEATTLSGSGDFRIAQDYSWPGLPQAALSLGNNVTAYWAGNLNSGTGSFCALGELSGTASSKLMGGSIGGRQLTWRIGGRGGDSTFAGTIAEQANGITHLVKQGQGTWTFSGTATTNGDLTVEAGTLAITGSFSQLSNKTTRVSNNSTLSLNGFLQAGSMVIDQDALLSGTGSFTGNLSNSGTGSFTTGTFTVTGNLSNSGYLRVKSPGALVVNGTLNNTGVLNLIGSTQGIPAGTVNTGVILADRAPTTLTWTGANGSKWDLQTSVNWTRSPAQADVFFQGDSVIIDSTAPEPDLELEGDLQPASVTVNSSLDISFTGGALSGSGSLVKSGTGSLAITSALKLTGAITVNGGGMILSAAEAWPALSPVIDLRAGATLNVTPLVAGVTVGSSQVLRGSGKLSGAVKIRGVLDPVGTLTLDGSSEFEATSRISWSLTSHATNGTTFDSIQAGAVQFGAGAAVDLVFSDAGSSVDFTQPFWATPKSWTFLTAASLSGPLALGTIGPDRNGVSSLPSGTFTLSSTATTVTLQWTPVVVTAKWRGTANANWDLTSANWLRNGTITTFLNNLVTQIDDGGTITAINLTDSVSPSALEFDSTKNYSLGGTGAITGSATLRKKGSGSCSMSSANSFTGGTTIEAGTLAISNAGALGTGTVTLAGGTWDTGALTPLNTISVVADSRIIGGSAGGFHGVKAITGSGLLTLESNSVFDLEGSLTGFTGNIVLAGSGSVRLNGSFGSSGTGFQLGSRTLSARNGGTYALGSLSGDAASTLNITSLVGAVTYSIGGRGESTVFAGSVANGPGTLSLIKTGNGSLTLTGTCSHTGSTAVNGGTLRVSGTFGTSAVTVAPNATLDVLGNMTPASLNLAAGSTLIRPLGNSMGSLQVAGNLTLAGVLKVVPQAGVRSGRFVIATHGGTRSGSFSTMEPPVGISTHLRYEANAVVLFLDDSDEDGLPDSWEMENFGNLAQGPDGDLDGDGTSNRVEYVLGLNPRDPASAFRADASYASLSWPSAPGLVFTVQRSLDLGSASWQAIGTITGGPGNRATFVDPNPPGRSFYRVSFEP